MSKQIERLQETIRQTRNRLIEHPLYTGLDTLEALQKFASLHVFAVWDFMSLLKSLQRKLTCTELPWVPVGNPATRYLVNEIVLGEESDIDMRGHRISHFELYLEAMEQMGADTAVIRQLLANLQNRVPLREALLQLPRAVQEFVGFTFDIIEKAPLPVQAAVFTFGREDLIPDLFMALVKDLSREHPEKLGLFRYYLERHIEVDGGHHSHLAVEMVEQLCGNDDLLWEKATQAANKSLLYREKLWDAVYQSLNPRVVV